MEELQDAIEDAQYVNAINTQEDGPKPVLPWEKPSDEVMERWAATKKWDLDSFLESAISFFLFSSFIKTKHDDYLRINFCEDVLRFKKLRGRSRRKQAQFIMEHYCKKLRSKQGDSEESQNSSTAKTPPRTEIDECDLERKVSNLKATAFLKDDASFKFYCDYPKCTQSVVGIRDAILDDLLDDWREWEDQERKSTVFRQSDNNSQNSGERTPVAQRKNSSGDPNPDENTKSLEQEKPANGGSSEGDDKIAKDAETAATAAATVTTSANEEDGHEYASAPLEIIPPAEKSTLVEKANSTPAAAQKLSNMNTIMSTGDLGDATVSMRILTQKFKSQNEAVHDALFDKAETIVMESLRRDYWDLFLESEEFAKAKNFWWYMDRPVVPDDFYTMRILGRGGFGLVHACKKGTSGKLYAMKMMNKRRIKMKKSEPLAMNERLALAAVESNFVVNLKYSFHSKDDVFLILDLMTGGDLGFHLHQKGRFPKREVQYYAARIMLGLQALHDQGYVYRDLKPENCLMAEDGRVKITDLGLATRITPALHGAAGTRGYWAPEMLRRDKKGKRMPYGHTVDWFSFGCCVTEFICGANPFRSEAALNFGLAKGRQTKEKAIDCATLEMEPDFPKEFFESDAKDLCVRLLEKDEKKRLGTGGCEEIMAHPYFKNLNWEAIISDRKRPPFIPAKDVNAASQSEIGNFLEDKAYQETTLTEQDEAYYKDWDWTNPRAYASEVIEFLIYERETGRPLLPIQPSAGCCCVLL